MLALFNPKAPTKISADASSYGLGAVLLQQVEEKWKPVAYASRSMTDTEKRYAQIEKEALAVTWSISTDHEPLVPLLSTKNLDNLPPRVLRFRLRLAWHDYSTYLESFFTLRTLYRDHGSELTSATGRGGAVY